MNRVRWRITKVSEKLRMYPKGTSLFSKVFAAAGIKGMQFEFAPNGSAGTKTRGNCAFYFKAPVGTRVTVTLFVGRFSSQPATVTFDADKGKGKPDFCLLADQIEGDAVEVGVQLHAHSKQLLSLES